LLLLVLLPSDAAAQSWTFHGVVAQGSQHDAVRGPKSVIHLVSSRYYQINANRKVLVDEAVGDGQQGSLSFPPAIAAGDDGTVHLVTRHSGAMSGGYDIRYRRRNSGGKWDRSYLVGSRVKRNYVVGVAWAGAGQVYMSSTQGGGNVWGDIHIWQPGASSAKLLGKVSGIWRADCHARLRATPGRVFLVSGKPDGSGGTAYLTYGKTGSSLVADLNKNKKAHKAGSGRTGFPDVYMDAKKNVHFTFGAEKAAHYNKYSSSGGKAYGSDRLLASGLGKWHLSSGLSAVAGSDDGKTVVAVVVRSDGTQAASNSDLLWTISTDSGATWRKVQDTKRNTNAGEGRRLPRLVAMGNRFFLFYGDKSASGISLATMHAVASTPDAGPPPPDKGAPPRDKKVSPPKDTAVTRERSAVPDVTTGQDGAASIPGGKIEGGCSCGVTPGFDPGAAILALALLFFLGRRRQGA